ncbi:MAG: HlyC/CorC family transporter [Planctomycetes bacterium]|nr:HlyC/CorC family transporter [Planctomycetota bacterium]
MSGINIIILLICISSGTVLFFSANTIALRTASYAKLREAFREINKEFLADELMENTEKLILTCSLYKLIFNICILILLLAAFAVQHQNSLKITDYLLTFAAAIIISSVFSLAIPHAWAKYSGEKILSRTYKTLMLFASIAAPALYVFGLYDSLIRRLAGVAETTAAEQQEEKQEEFLTELEQHRMEGAVDKEQQEMIENVLELEETTADEIMTPRTDIVAIDAKADRQKVISIITNAGHSRVPVYKDNIDNIIGLVYAKDLLGEIGNEKNDFSLQNKMRKVYFVPETKPLRTLLREFQNQKLHMAVVLDEYGGTAGIVTLEDVLEELVGEIADEYEKPQPETINKIDRSTIEVDARTHIDDLNDRFELNLPEDEDYDTVGGFVFSHLGCIPKTGETFDYENLKFTITLAKVRKIERIKIHKNTEIQQ